MTFDTRQLARRYVYENGTVDQYAVVCRTVTLRQELMMHQDFTSADARAKRAELAYLYTLDTKA